MSEHVCLANMSCQRLSIVSIVFSFVLRVLFCNDIVDSMIIKLFLAKRWVSYSNLVSKSFKTRYNASKSFFVV